MIFSNDSFFHSSLCREILHIQPRLHRHVSIERCRFWDDNTAVLNSLQKSVVKVTSRSVSEQNGLLVKNYKIKWNKEEKSSSKSLHFTNFIRFNGPHKAIRFNEPPKADSKRKRHTN